MFGLNIQCGNYEMYKIKKNATILYHHWSDVYKLPDGYRKIVSDVSFVIENEKLLHDPEKGAGGWTELAWKKSTAGRILTYVHPLFENDPKGLSNFEYLEKNYYLFSFSYPDPEVDLIAVHKKNVEVIK